MGSHFMLAEAISIAFTYDEEPHSMSLTSGGSVAKSTSVLMTYFGLVSVEVRGAPSCSGLSG